MYNLNLLPPVRSARVGGFDYPSTSLRAGQANPLGIASISSKPKTSNLKSITNDYTRSF